MLIRRDVLDRITTGEISLAFRQWKKPTVRAGGTLQTAVGVLAIDAIDPITDKDVTDHDAQRAGFASRESLLQQLCRHRGDQLYRISVRLAGADPRIALRETSRLSADDVAALRDKLDRLDQSSRVGKWTRSVLHAIAAAPGMKAGDLAPMVGLEREWLKTNVRKLKELGLTESLSPGYRLSPRGRALLKRLENTR